MKIGRIQAPSLVALCLGGVMAVTSMSASAALPEWRQGTKELAKEVAFTVEDTNGKLEGGTEVITCKKGKSVGAKLKNAKETNEFTIKSTGCSTPTCEINSPTLKPGEVETKKLKGKLGYLEKSTKKVGLLTKPVSGEEYTALEGACIGKTTVKGSAIGETSPVNKEESEAKLVFEKGVGSEQKWTKFEGESETHTLKAFSSTVWLKTTETIKFGTEKVELAA
jgi:hypothetical protein